MNDQGSYLEEMRIAREGYTAAFKNFTENHRKFDTHIFCFYEGEDGKYYNQKIRLIVGDDIIPIICKDKRNTLKTLALIKSHSEYNTAKKMFFVDCDMDECIYDDDLFVTPCYSVENLYANRKALEDILISEFSLNKTEDDLKRCLEKFDELFEQFNNIMIEFNALVLIRMQKKKNNGEVCLNDIKTSHLVSIELTGISKGSRYDEKITTLKDQLMETENELELAVHELHRKGNFSTLFRGKNQLDFFITIINKFKEQYNNRRFFSEKRDSVKINISCNRLSELSQYAIFPSCLQEFIAAHR